MLNEQTLIAKELIDTGKYNEAENILLGLNDKFSIFELAKLRRIQGRNREAEKLYLKALSVQPEIKYPIENDINIELGRIYAGFGYIKEAKERFEKGIDRASIDKNIYRELGELYLNTKQYKDAQISFEKAFTMFPDDIKTNLNLATIYRLYGETEKAKLHLNKLLSQSEIKNNKYLYNKLLNEYEILMKREILESNPRQIRNALTTKCNAGCRYCSVWKDNSSWKQDDKITKEVIGLFPYLESAHWLGGEVFLYKGFNEILEEGFKYDNLTQTILTNGLLLNKEILEKLSQGKEGRIRLIIAIDAGTKETYEYLRRGSSWEKLCSNLELIKEINHNGNRIHTTFNAVISKSNYKEVYDMIEMAKKYNFDRVRFMNILGDSEENIFLRRDMKAIKYLGEVMPLVEHQAKEYGLEFESHLVKKDEKFYYNDVKLKMVNDNKYNLIKPKESFTCYHPWTRVVIDQKGPIRPCERCSDWIGDSTKQTISEFWNSKGMQIFRKEFSRGFVCGGSGYQLEDNIYGGPNDVAEWSVVPLVDSIH